MFKKIQDTEGRTWKMQVTFPVLRMLADEGIVDLLAEPDPLEAQRIWLGLDAIKKIDAIGIAILLTETQEQQFDVDSFAVAINEKTIWDGALAFAESLADFYPTHAELIHKVLASTQAKIEQSREVMTEFVTLGNFDSRLSEIMDSQTVGNGPTNSQDS